MTEFGESIKNKPFTIILLSALGAAILGSMIYFGAKNKENLSESIELFVQKMAPALNETTGFLVISYAVILCLGNVIMKTSPKYLASGGESQEDKTTGFVAWLQSKGLGWLPIFISVTVVTLMTFLPINNKILKIGIIAIILGGVLVAALFFNAIIKLFGGKESFTNVKEEFGHGAEKHPFEIAVGTQKWKEDNTDNVVYFRYDNADETHNTDSSLYQAPGTANHGAAVNNIELNNEIFNNQLTIKLNKGEAQGADIYYSEFPWGSPGGETTLKKIESPLTITVEGEYKTIFFHSFKKGTLIFKSPPTIATTGDTKYKLDDNGIAYIDTSGEETMAGKEYCIWEKHTEKKLKTGPYVDNVKSIVFWGGDENKPMGYITDSKVPLGVVINLKNMQQFFDFDVDVVKKSVSDSYIAYYCLVWGSFVGYAFYNWKQLWNNKEFSMKIVPFLVAAVVETLLIAQSNSSLNESDVASNSGEASPTFNYAIAGFSTRIATVVAFLSTILSQVKD